MESSEFHTVKTTDFNLFLIHYFPNPATAITKAPVFSMKSPSSIPFSNVLENLVTEIQNTANSYFSPNSLLPRHDLESLIWEATRASDDSYGVQAAIEWSQDYHFPQSLLDQDLASSREAGFNFEVMVQTRLQQLAPYRLNAARIDQLRSDHPDKLLLCDLADGMRIPLPTGFTLNEKEPTAKLRGAYMNVHQAVNRLSGDLVNRRLAFLLPKTLAIDFIPNLHLCAAHWTPKKGKARGRPIGDLSHVSGTPLNTDEKQLRLWKMNLRGAYQLISFRPPDAGLFGIELTGDLIYLQIAGIFGWSSIPAAFQVITRAIQWELKHLLDSLILMYVDDIIGMYFAKDIASDLGITRNVCMRLLGPTAVADDKTETGTNVDILG